MPPECQPRVVSAPWASEGSPGTANATTSTSGIGIGGQPGIVALEASPELFDARVTVEPGLCGGEAIEPVGFDAGNGAVQCAGAAC